MSEETNTKLIKFLDANPEELDSVEKTPKEDNKRTNNPLKRVAEGNCMECEDTPAAIKCDQCLDSFCDLCFKTQHRKGKRVAHTFRKLKEDSDSQISDVNSESISTKTDVVPTKPEQSQQGWLSYFTSMLSFKGWSEDYSFDFSQTVPKEKIGEWMTERCKYIPVRLTLKERKALRLVEAALFVSDYTDKIDIENFKNKGQRIHAQLQETCAILLGIAVAAEYKIGQELIQNKNFKEYNDFYEKVLELGRRHKIMNPEKMRTEYGKLLYMLQDAVSSELEELLGFNLVRPIRTVYTVFQNKNCLKILEDPNIIIATQEIIDDGKKSRSQIQRDIKQKEAARDYIAKRYSTAEMEEEQIRQCLYSIGDNNSFLTFNRDPVDKMIFYLKNYFSPTQVEEGFSLAISGGQNGSRLTHSHERQYYFVLQSLTLWREVLHDMFKLWYLAEEDLLDASNKYRLKDTGQGLNRVQEAPRIYKAISKILHLTQQKVGSWVGSSVIHLGDHNVPNALMFIDKYTQVPRILGPIVKTVEQIDQLVKDSGLKNYIYHTFGGVDDCKKEILLDFFRHAFDGSGADNFFDAGSCIDGRLTSAWNWCSQIDKKRFYPIFKLTGFTGFDGDFQK